MITIHGVYRSRASRPLWLLGEIGLPFRHEKVIQAYRLPNATAPDAPLNTTSPAFLKINPQGQIPAMEEDGLVLTESLAICLYIAKAYGNDLGPRTLAEDAQMTQWALFGATSVEGPALEIMVATTGPDAARPEQQGIIAVAAEKLRRPLSRLQDHLAAHRFMVGDRFTVADIMVAECVRYAQGHAALMAEFPAVKTWLDTCQARPAFQAMWAARLAEPA